MIELEQLKEEIEKLQREIEELERQQKNNPTAWTPKEGENVYMLISNGLIMRDTYNEHTDIGKLTQGSLFPTEEAAEWERERRKVLHEMKRYASEFVHGDNNYVIYFNNDDGYIKTEYWSVKQFGTLYFESKEKAQACIDAIGEERLKKYYFNVKE